MRKDGRTDRHKEAYSLFSQFCERPLNNKLQRRVSTHIHPYSGYTGLYVQKNARIIRIPSSAHTYPDGATLLLDSTILEVLVPILGGEPSILIKYLAISCSLTMQILGYYFERCDQPRGLVVRVSDY